ncbi:helix-turn-helix domain-containing protein [Bradyrhizobium sp. BRP22]|uniref:AraC family transcriptional regulator n=1 Tax=Bradyrhizobium sp. BRP22 TaxID=2793821 RepID=UPI001CD44ECB|nr:helix-turn-helix domain-containing protein [Bradyrhizobium sp. BRP22]MCA1455902.1 helix-turn-helix domain-containing protein [Bradyrhizobium sp. BRP22]
MLQDAVQDAPTEILQLERGQMTGELTHLSVGRVGASTGTFSRGLRSRGILSERRWVLGMTLDGSPALFQNIETMPGDLVIVQPGTELYARYVGSNAYASIFVEPEELFAFLGTDPGAQDAWIWRQPVTVLSTDPTTGRARAAGLRMLLNVVAAHGETMTAGSAEYYRLRILELMTGPVIHSAGWHHRKPRLSLAVSLVRDVDRFLVDAGPTRVNLTDLAHQFGVSPRALQHAFAEVLGVPPREFFRRKRLGAAHTALLTAGPGDTVTRIAIEHGFADVGRFARDYSEMFGEQPNQTLRRRNIIVRRET